MAKNIDRLSSGQTPSLLQASKGNELIDAINAVRKSKSSANANGTGISLKVTGEGSLELDLTQSAANALTEIQQSTTQLGTGVKTLTTVENGVFVSLNFVIA